MIKIKLNTHLKIAIGYIVLIVVLGFSGWLLYSNMRSQQNVSEASVIFMRRQNAAEQMIYSMLKVSTARACSLSWTGGRVVELQRSSRLCT